MSEDGRALVDDGPAGARGLKNLPVVGTVAAVLFTICVIGGTGVYQQMASAGRAERAAQAHIDRMVSAASERCSRMAPGQRHPCIAQAREVIADKVDDVRRDYADLTAQQTTAIWAMWMGIAAVVGMAVTAGGTYLLLATLRETRRTNRIAMDARRPWVSIEIEPIKVRMSETSDYYHYQVILANLSDTAVVDLTVRDEVDWLPCHKRRNPPEPGMELSGSSPTGGVILPNAPLRLGRYVHVSHSVANRFRVRVIVEFKGPGDPRTWHVSRSFTCEADLTGLNEQHHVPPEQMTIVTEDYIRVS